MVLSSATARTVRDLFPDYKGAAGETDVLQMDYVVSAIDSRNADPK